MIVVSLFPLLKKSPTNVRFINFVTNAPNSTLYRAMASPVSEPGTNHDTLITPVWVFLLDAEENNPPDNAIFHCVQNDLRSGDMLCVAYQDPLG